MYVRETAEKDGRKPSWKFRNEKNEMDLKKIVLQLIIMCVCMCVCNIHCAISDAGFEARKCNT